VYVCKQQKQQENEQALKLLSARLVEIDRMSSDEQWLSVIMGVLAGNVFDWGAKEVASLMESAQFGFSQALCKLQGEYRHRCSVFFPSSAFADVFPCMSFDTVYFWRQEMQLCLAPAVLKGDIWRFGSTVDYPTV